MPVSRDHLAPFLRRIYECGCTSPRLVSWVEIARRLNAAGHRTYYGALWTGPTVRGFVKNHGGKKLGPDGEVMRPPGISE